MRIAVIAKKGGVGKTTLCILLHTPTWRCPKCGATVTVSVSERDNDSRCGACGFKPYDWRHPNMPPLIDDIVMSEEGWRRFNAEAEELAKAAKEIGFNDYRAAIDRLFEGPITPDEK
jgi:predicted RNA-binding Zn-ribbon protein involved in translation (DUF1610 family)